MQLGTGRVSPLQQPRTASHWYVFESGSGAAGFGLCGLPAAADMRTAIQSNAAGPLRWGRPGRTVGVGHGDVVEHEPLHRLARVAEQHARRQHRLLDVHIPQRDVPEADAALGRAVRRDRVVQRALLAERGVRLVLLLRPDPDRPPGGPQDAEVLVEDGSDLRGGAGRLP